MIEKIIEILLVEDNPNDIELTLDALKNHNLSNNVKVLTDGAKALDYIFNQKDNSKSHLMKYPQLILLDLKLPKVSGLEVLEKIKSDDSTKHIPVVVLTSSREEKDVIESYKLGVNSYIVKPVDFDQFVNAVTNLGLYWILLNEYPPSNGLT
jgi:CheY-like chemotaxis protein